MDKQAKETKRKAMSILVNQDQHSNQTEHILIQQIQITPFKLMDFSYMVIE